MEVVIWRLWWNLLMNVVILYSISWSKEHLGLWRTQHLHSLHNQLLGFIIHDVMLNVPCGGAAGELNTCCPAHATYTFFTAHHHHCLSPWLGELVVSVVCLAHSRHAVIYKILSWVQIHFRKESYSPFHKPRKTLDWNTSSMPSGG